MYSDLTKKENEHSDTKEPEQNINRKQFLIECADRVFIKKGYYGAGLTEIARNAGVQKSSIFHHFTSKENLAEDVLRHNIIFFENELFRRCDTLTSQPVTSINLFFDLLANAFLLKKNALLILVILKSAESHLLDLLIEENIKQWTSTISLLLQPLHEEETAHKLTTLSLWIIFGFSISSVMNELPSVQIDNLIHALRNLWLKNRRFKDADHEED